MRFVRVALAVMSCAACGEGEGPDPPPVVVIAAIFVSPSADSIVAPGGTMQFLATARDANDAVIPDVTFWWASSAPGVATIDSASGMATAVSPGTTVITAHAGATSASVTLLAYRLDVAASIEGRIADTLFKPVTGAIFARQQRSLQAPARPVVRQVRARTAGRRVPRELIVTLDGFAPGMPTLRAGERPGATLAGVMAATVRASVSAVLASGTARVAGVSPVTRSAKVLVAPGASMAAVEEALRRIPGVRAVEPNGLVYSTGIRVPRATDHGAPSARWPGEQTQRRNPWTLPNDPMFPEQSWHYSMIGLPVAWAMATGSADVIVAVVDDGIRFDHSGIAANLTQDGYDFVAERPETMCGGTQVSMTGDGDGPDQDPTIPLVYRFDFVNGCLGPQLEPVGGHGLHVAGTIGAAGNDGQGGTGTNWRVRIRPVRVLGADQSGTEWDVAQGILYAAGFPADNGAGGTVTAPSPASIINLSLGGGASYAIGDAVRSATAGGSLVVASAGNDPFFGVGFPASMPEVVAVAALAPTGLPASYSSLGEEVDLAAPGGEWYDDQSGRPVGVHSTIWNFETRTPSYTDAYIGTSMAAPHVSGVAALVLGANPGLSRDALRARLEDNATSHGAGSWLGRGVVNAARALVPAPTPAHSTVVALLGPAGEVVRQTRANADGTYRFDDVPSGTYYVVAGMDEDGDARPGLFPRRWGAHGSAARPAPVTITGPGIVRADLELLQPEEIEPNTLVAQANMLLPGHYMTGYIGFQLDDRDFYVVPVSTAGTRIFETTVMGGACGFGFNADATLELRDSAGQTIAQGVRPDDPTGRICSRIEQELAPGTYYLRVTPRASAGRFRYVVVAR